MRKIILIICMLLVFNVKAENIIQFTGGNYIFVEDGRLIFNLEPSVLEAREWRYNESTDSFDTEFKANMRLKTLYTDSFSSYEVKLNNQYYQVAYGYRPSDSYTLQPVYYRKTLLPAIGWAARVGAVVSRQVLPPLIQKCLTNVKCASTLGSVAINSAFLCGLAYEAHGKIGPITFPGSICKKAEQEGYHRDEAGNLVRKYKYGYHCVGGLCLKPGGNGRVGGFSTYAEAVSAAKSQCPSSVSPQGEHASYKNTTVSSGMVVCLYETESGHLYSINYGIDSYASPVEERISMVDISRYIMEDMKENPTPYINSDGLGNEIRDAVKLKSADLQSGLGRGSFSVIGSEPYRDPRTGKTVQDLVTVDSATKNQNSRQSKLSGNAGAGASGDSGVSPTVNNATVKQIGRGDVEDSAKVGTPNNPNGTNGTGKGNSNGSGSGKGGSGNGSGNGSGDGDGDGKCDGLQNTVGCMPVGDLPTDTDIEVPGKDDDIMELAPDNFLPSDGSCPSPIKVGTSIISYEPACYYAQKIRMLVILIGIMTAGSIIFKGFK
jgi:hypothetical protein